MKILTLNSLKYSKEKFDGYAFRARVRLTTVKTEHTLDIYTTDENKENVLEVLVDRKHDDVTSITIKDWLTKEDDDRQNEFLNEWLNEI